MDQNEERKKAFIAELDKQIAYQNRARQIADSTQMGLMFLIAVAGFLTGAAGLDKLHSFWYSQPHALLVWGAMATIGAAFNQFSDPGRRSHHHLMTKIALKSIKGAVEFRGLSISEADRFRSRAWVDPGGATEELSRLQFST